MGWFANMFASGATTTRKGQALSSTHEAFSLPTSSPSFSHTAYGSPVPDSAASYTYPPPSSTRGSYDYVPSPTTTRRQSSLLPLHSGQQMGTPQSAVALDRTWARLRAWLSANYPELGDTLNYGATAQDIADCEMQLGLELPAPVRESYLLVDGQEPESAGACSSGLFFGLTLLPLEDVLEEWRFWREVDDDPHTGASAQLRDGMASIPPGWVRREYSCRGWIPLATDKAGNYLGVDLSPGEGGSVGQVIIFGRDIDAKVVLWHGDGPNGWATWLTSFVDELEAGEGFEFAGRSDGNDEEDDVGYESYYYEGDGRGDAAGGSAPGSLRLAGEYRGWDVLQALADKSMRRWHQAGLITENTAGKPPKVGLGVLDLVPPAPDSIPSTSATHESPTTVTAAAAAATTDATPKDTPTKEKPRHKPGQSLSKAPAPKPFALPTEQDIFPESDTPEYSPVEGDIESGQAVFMRELAVDASISRPEGGGLASPQPKPAAKANPLADITDLLHDGESAAKAKTPSPPPLIPSIAIGEHDDTPAVAEPSPVVASPKSPKSPQDESPAAAAAAPAAPAAPAADEAGVPSSTVSSTASGRSSSGDSSTHSEEFEDVDASDLVEVDEMGRRTDGKDKETTA